MKVHDIMAAPPRTCHVQTELASASRRMHETGTGTLVVLDDHARVTGIITDRDVAMALGVGHRGIDRLPVGRVMTRRVHTCSLDDDVQDALAEMSRYGVRRLPVTSSDGDLKGVISIDDIVLWAIGEGGVTARKLVPALRRIVSPRTTQPEPDMPGL